MCRCGAAGYSVSMLSVKPELEQAFNQLCSDVVLHIRVVIAVHLREVADISSVSVKDGLYRYGVALMCLYDSVIGEKSVTHGTAPPFPLLAAGKVLAGKSVIFAFCGVVGSKRKNASPQPFMKKLVIDFLKKWQ